MHKEFDRYLSVNGLSVRYREWGEGPLLLLVHGISGFLEEWEPAMEILCKHYRVISMDLPGHGLSDKPEMIYTLDFLTDSLKEFIVTLRLEKIYLAGHSLGGAVCCNLVVKYPHIVERLVLVNSAFIKVPFFIQLGSFAFLQRLKLKIPIQVVKASARNTFYKKECISKKWLDSAYKYTNEKGALWAMFSIIRENRPHSRSGREQSSRLIKGLKNLNIPVLILYGDKDRIIPNQNSEQLHRYIKNSECVKVKDCGHEMQYENCEIFCEQVIRFLSP